MKKWVAVLLFVIIISMFVCTCALAANSTDEYEDLSAEQYAYLDINEITDEALKEKVLESRKQIIYSRDWVADGFIGRVRNMDGEIVRELPNFSEVFPGWDLPVEEVDSDREFIEKDGFVTYCDRVAEAPQDDMVLVGSANVYLSQTPVGSTAAPYASF